MMLAANNVRHVPKTNTAATNFGMNVVLARGCLLILAVDYDVVTPHG